MLPVQTRHSIAEALCTKAFQKTMLPYYLLFRIVNKKKTVVLFRKILHENFSKLMEYCAKGAEYFSILGPS